MKKLFIIYFILQVNLISAQTPCIDFCLDFEDWTCMDQLSIDTISCPDNIWQVGTPQKPSFGTAYSSPFVIITDTLNPYPVKNRSAFTILNEATSGYLYGCELISGYYYVQTDSLHDYGLMEFSPDKGTTWIDMINDTVYDVNFHWFSAKPELTGNSYGWKHFECNLWDLGSVFSLQCGDTVLIRFTFVSDSIAESLGGLMFDNLCFHEFYEGISDIHFKTMKSNIYPNPSSGQIIIEFENPKSEPYQLNVYSTDRRLVFSKEKIIGNSITFESLSLKAGVYIYKLTNMNEPKRSWGKFIVSP